MSIRLIALDLDDTLLDSSHRLPPGNIAAVRRAAAAGIHVLLASARPPRSMRRYHRELELTTPLVAYNGALVYDLARQRALWHTPVPPAAARTVVARLRAARPDLNISIECEDRWHIDCYDDDLKRTVAEYGLEPPHGVGTVDALLGEGSASITKILFADPGMGEVLLAELNRDLGPEVSVVRTSSDLVEVVAAGVSKAAGVACVADALGIAAAETLAVGDSYNDVPLLRWAGVGIAMSNAPETVRRAADEVTLAQDQGGVAAAINKHVPD